MELNMSDEYILKSVDDDLELTIDEISWLYQHGYIEVKQDLSIKPGTFKLVEDIEND